MAGPIYRGYRVDLPSDLNAQVDKLAAPPMEESDIDQHLRIGALLVDWLSRSHPDKFGEGLGLGRHWTRRRDMAEGAALQGSRSGHTGIILEADYDDRGVDREQTGTTHFWAESEDEVTLLPGAAVTVTGVWLYNDYRVGRWNLVSTPIRARASLPSGLYWRAHPTGRPFSSEDASSTAFSYDAKPRKGYSCVRDPWHLYIYLVRMGWFDFRGGRSVKNETELIAFSGTETTRKGVDGEILAIPDMQTVRRFPWDEFERELLSTPIPEFWRPKNTSERTWEQFCDSYVWRMAPGSGRDGRPSGAIAMVLLDRFAPDKAQMVRDAIEQLNRRAASLDHDFERLASLPKLWWRIHPPGRPFSVDDATSTTFNPVSNGQREMRSGYSCFADPWHLWLYLNANRMNNPDGVIVGFSGERIGEGNDGEDLVVPDMRTVRRMSMSAFESELASTPLPPSPKFSSGWWGYNTWAEARREYASFELGDHPLVDRIIEKAGVRRMAAYPTPEQMRILDDIYEQAPLTAMIPERACFEASTEVARRLGWQQVGGYYDQGRGFWGREGHFWNVMPDGTIVDVTHDQFDPDEPIMIARPGTPEHARYVRGGVEDTLVNGIST